MVSTGDGQREKSPVQYPRHEHTAHDHASPSVDVVHHLFVVDGIDPVFGISALVHALLLAGIFITLAVFETAKRRPQYFGGLGRGRGGEHD